MKKTILIILFILFNIQLSYARPVSKVYRADSRPPEEVFKKGFVAWGNNINFHAHVNGVSGRRGSKDSAFIPTTSSFKSSEKFAKDLLNVSTDNKSYIYQIRATHNFYSALDTVYYYHDRIKERVSDVLRAVLTAEQEYSAYMNIPNQLIELVTIYTKNGSDITQETITNPHYSLEKTQSSVEPYKGYTPSIINSLPHLVMGLSMTNINNELAEASAVLPSSSFTWGSVLSTVMEVAETL
ncbi:scabin-related ADP-ribosyltransferase [Proteus penneri]|uniref:scabin-related ADP-ribosyltransferase n=2 Tax=Proteus TaxID=583 RepID=UPI0028894051|nr:enterotoxin A family protein [Proteus penneri]